jgi:ABC-type branched-subunit amino acid transport system substrate-binding protein
MIIRLPASKLLITALIALGIAVPAAAQTPGVTANSILLGQSAAFSGPAAQLGIEMNAGAVAYFDYINKQGGVHGRTKTTSFTVMMSS